jgi:hypothetical protein
MELRFKCWNVSEKGSKRVSKLGNEILKRIGEHNRATNPRLGREDFEQWISEGNITRFWFEAVCASSEGTINCMTPKETLDTRR